MEWAIKNTTTGEILPERYTSRQMANVDCQAQRVLLGERVMQGLPPHRLKVIEAPATTDPKLFG